MSENWRNHYDRYRLASPPEAPNCPECEDGEMHEDDHVWVCPECGYETSDPDDELDARAEDAAIERAERQREDAMFDRDDREDW